MFDEIVSDLLLKTGASRTTLRLDRPPEVFPIAAEALAPGVKSLKGATSIDLRKAPTLQHMARHLDLLIQDDLLTAVPAAPPELIEAYGARAQMLAPIVDGTDLVGVVSVHECRGPRHWTETDIQSLTSARDAIQSALASA